MRLPPLLSQLDFNEKNALLDIENEKTLLWTAISSMTLRKSREMLSLRVWRCITKNTKTSLRQLYAEFALWIFDVVWC